MGSQINNPQAPSNLRGNKNIEVNEKLRRNKFKDLEEKRIKSLRSNVLALRNFRPPIFLRCVNRAKENPTNMEIFVPHAANSRPRFN